MNRPEEAAARRWLVTGRVQGVGFRWFVARAAGTLGLVGWASNLPDGRVEVVASGVPEALEELGRTLSRGPRLARVDHVETEEYPHEMTSFKTFEIR